MYLEAVIVCVNYSDFLAHTLPENRTMFDNMVVVTSLNDLDTVRICNKYNVRCIQTDAFYQNKEVFNKGAGINVGLKALNRTGWVLHLDADIYLPPLTRHVLRKECLQPNKIYSADRLMCPDYESWAQYRRSWRSVHEDWSFTHLDLFRAGSRIVQYGEYLDEGTPDGWVPIGYFQLWNPNGSGIHTYPANHGAADRSDVLHAKQWTRANRVLIPEVVVIHLESEECTMGANWRGRRTMWFGPAPQLPQIKEAEVPPEESCTHFTPCPLPPTVPRRCPELWWPLRGIVRWLLRLPRY
jgi:hypothetical protein